MNILREFFETKRDDEFDQYRQGCFRMASGYVSKHKKLTTCKDEYEDLMQDTILCFLECIEKYNKNKGSFYALYKYGLKTLKQKFISMYLGIGMSYNDYLKSKDDLVLSKVEYQEYFLLD